MQLWKKAKIWYSQLNSHNSDSMSDENVDMDEEIADVIMQDPDSSESANDEGNNKSSDSSSGYSPPPSNKRIKHFI